MESRYKSIKHIGEGAFSSVILALNIETGEKVAIKKMKKRRWKDTAAQAEISALQKLHHENIIRLLDVFREDYRSFLVFECMDCDLNELVVSRNGRRLPDTVVLDITYQVLNGLDFIHRNDLFHRDIKPENVLIRRHVTSSGPGGNSAIVVEAKIADFGLVHDMDFSRPLTDYISTRWYRAPEVLLNCANYSTPIDVWAVGTIVAELSTLRPLFPGNNQIDQLRRIFDVLGTPRISAPVAGSTEEDSCDSNGSWYEGAVHARKLGIAFVPSTRKPLGSVIPETSSVIVQLVDYILVLNPNDRPSAKDALGLVSRMLDQALGEPLPQDDERSVSAKDPAAADDVQMVPAPRASLSQSSRMSEAQAAVVPDTKESQGPNQYNGLSKPSMTVRPNIPIPSPAKRNVISPIFGPVGMQSATLQSPATTPAAIASASASASVSAASAVAPLASASTKISDNDDDDDDDEIIDKTLNGHSLASPAAAAKQRMAVAAIQDGRISFTPRDKFDQQLINGQIKRHSLVEEAVKPIREGSSGSAGSMGSAATSRPSVEINIVRGMHREPMRDPRGDLSALVPAGVVPMSSSSSCDSGSIISLASDVSMSASDRQSVSFSVSDIPSPLSNTDPNVSSANDLRLYSDTPSVIGNVPMTKINDASSIEPAAVHIIDEEPLAASASNRHSMDSCSSSDITACRSANARKSHIINKEPVVVNVSALRSAQALAIANVARARDDGFVHIEKNSTNGSSSAGMASPATSQKTVDSPTSTAAAHALANANGAASDSSSANKSPGKLLGLRQKNGALSNSPLIRRALSIKKKPQPVVDQAPPAAAMPQLTSQNNLSLFKSSPPPVQEAAIKRSKSALDIGEASTVEITGTGLGLLDINQEINLDNISRTLGFGVSESLSSASMSSKPKKKDEWIANTQFLRQRLGNTAKDSDHSGGHSNRMSVASTVARKRRSSVGDVHQMLSVRETTTNAALMPDVVPVLHAPGNGRRQPVPSGLFAGTSPLQQQQQQQKKPGRQSKRSTFTEKNAVNGAARDNHGSSNIGDYLGVRIAMDRVMRSDAQDNSKPLDVDNVAKDVMAGLDSFAPVTFDANTLFRNQLLPDSVSGSPSPSSPFYSTKGGALSPADYMSTFSDVRSKFNSTAARNKHSNNAALVSNSGNGNAGSEQPSSHRFLSKMRHAFGGGRHGASGAGGRRRSASNSEKGAKSVTSRIVDAQPPRLDFDLGSSLLTPDSSLHKSDNIAAEHANKPKLDRPSVVNLSAAATAAPSSQVANDSAYYLIDYINSTDNDGGKADASEGYLSVSYSNNNNNNNRRESSLTPAARRVVNKSTRLRQTQYDYKFGSQIFECFDNKDLMLLKTDLFRGLDDGLDVSSMTEWMKSTSDTIGSITVKPGAKSSSKKKQVDVTKATAYTAAAINRIVAHNNKNRSNNVHAPSAAATSNSSQLSRQLMA
ncbi:hypothetical protein FB639_000668 [Coemansia asiatica]|nr:hypothetical protein FB639_000668 [Coemansia asiatica]